jgi:hypothetical protein
MSAPKKSYFDMAKEAIVALKERSGSSPQAIKAYITSKYPGVAFAQVRMSLTTDCYCDFVFEISNIQILS